ncbi:rab-protein geranylgeranyltransferase [Clavulina sp. PMI_390]|nr:rab-protein geranylgeranyltransferase [Clavulina sp. PMI_390]
MHGIKRVPKDPNEVAAEREQRERKKIAEYTALQDDLLAKKAAKDYSEDAFDQTTQLLTANPEFYTIWNYRRDILTEAVFPKSTPLNVFAVLQEDLQLTMAALKVHPKVYWIWNHRRWCLARIPLTPDDESRRDDELDWRREVWNRELFVVEKMLDADARNFHAWNYRRYVLASLPPPPPNSTAPARTPATELAYTQKKIEANFSNFSAWHQRTKIYEVTRELEDAAKLDEEFDLVNQAMYTLPSDQSAWLYHRWLIAQTNDPKVIQREIKIIQDLLQEEPDSKWCLESIVQYTLVLQKLESSTSPAKPSVDVMPLLDQLVKIDPMRKGRYEDVRKKLVQASA